MRLFGLITVALVAMAVIAITPVLSENSGETTVAKDNSGMGEAIKIYGDWEVKVTDPKTGMEKIYVFRNHLSHVGSIVLSQYIDGGYGKGSYGGPSLNIPQKWQILMAGNEGGNMKLGCYTKDDIVSGITGGSTDSSDGVQIQGSCVVGKTTVDENDNPIEVHKFTLPLGVNVSELTTMYAMLGIGRCYLGKEIPCNDQAASSIEWNSFSQKILDDSIPVSPGQLVSITVQYKFPFQ